MTWIPKAGNGRQGMARWMGFFLLAVILRGGLSAAASEVPAQLLVGDSVREVVLLGMARDQVTYRPVEVERGIQASVPVRDIRETRFEIDFDGGAVFDAVREQRFGHAAALILSAVAPALPYLALPENNAVRPAFEAANYLVRAARQLEAEGGEANREAVQRRYTQALGIFDAVAKADWLYEGELAALRSAECLVLLGRLLEAETRLNQARRPVEDDGAYGVYQLVRARLHFAYREWRDAADALVRVVVFDNKSADVFADALLLYGICHEEMFLVHRARDIYYEVARLFTGTEWGDEALARLGFLMDNDLTAQEEEARIARVFFGIEEDMNEKARALLEKYRTVNDTPDTASGDS